MRIEKILGVFGDWAIISAENPGGKKVIESDVYNVCATMDLMAELSRRGYRFAKLDGCYCGVPEKSLLIFGIPIGEAIELGRKYGQESILAPHGLVHCDSGWLMAKASGRFESADGAEDNYSVIHYCDKSEAFRYELVWE